MTNDVPTYLLRYTFVAGGHPSPSVGVSLLYHIWKQQEKVHYTCTYLLVHPPDSRRRYTLLSRVRATHKLGLFDPYFPVW